jgi:glutaminase
MLRDIRQQLADYGVKLVFCHAARLSKVLTAAGFEASAVFSNEDAALESCENAVLASVMQDHRMDPASVTLADCTIFADCDEVELKLLDGRMETISHGAGETIIQTGTDADELFVLTAGNVEVRLRLDSNRSQRLDVFSAGMSFGELAFLDGSPRSADIVAVTPVICRVISRSFFELLGSHYPTLKAKILNQIALQLCERLRQANIEISALRS